MRRFLLACLVAVVFALIFVTGFRAIGWTQIYTQPHGGGGSGTGSTDPSQQWTALAAAPASPVERKWYLADHTNWNPCSISGTVPYWVIYCSTCNGGGSAYFALWDIYGNQLINAPLSVDGHADQSLSIAQVSGTRIHNYNQSASSTQTLPAVSSSAVYSFVAPVETKVAQNWIFTRTGSDTVCLDGTCSLTSITYNNANVGSMMGCISSPIGLRWDCKTIIGNAPTGS